MKAYYCSTMRWQKSVRFFSDRPRHAKSTTAKQGKSWKDAAMSGLAKAVILGLLTGIPGLVVYLVPAGMTLEENFGLGMLFTLRRVRQAPAEVVIVGIDREPITRLHRPTDLEKRPRLLYARLIERVAQAGTAVIVFDVVFDTARSAVEVMYLYLADNSAA